MWNGLVAVVAVTGLAAAAAGQPAMAIRFANGQSEITVAPGSALLVQVWATGMPAIGTQIPWTTPPGTGQVGAYEGFLSVLFDVLGTGGSWSNLGIPSGAGFQPPPHGPPGVPSGSNVHAINVGVGFLPPIPHPDFNLWFGTLTVGSSDVRLDTLIRPVGFPPQTGMEIALSGLMPGSPYVSQFAAPINGTAVIHVPAPAGVVVIGMGGLLARRRRV